MANVTSILQRAKILAAVAMLSSIAAPAGRCQAQFDQARALLLELDRLQKSGLRDKPTIDRLNYLVAEVPQRTQTVLRDGILAVLNSPGNHSAGEVRQKLSAALQIVPPDEYQPEVFAFRFTTEQQALYLIAYNVPYCASCSSAWIGLVGKRGGHYEVLSEEGKEFAGKSLHVASLAESEARAARFLVYGTNLGDAHNRLTAMAYEVHDTRLRSIWTRADLPQGSVEVSPARISLTFLTTLNPPWEEKTEVYEVAQGKLIKLQGSVERPNP